MQIFRFEDIFSWQKAQDLAVHLYQTFEKQADPDFRNQIKSAVVSISNNIAEGFERSSDADFVRMLYIAKGSAGEVRSMIHLAVRLNFLPEDKKSAFLASCNEISRLITGLIKIISNRGRGRGTSIVEEPAADYFIEQHDANSTGDYH